MKKIFDWTRRLTWVKIEKRKRVDQKKSEEDTVASL